jgi:predicted metal-dependent hydrolase
MGLEKPAEAPKVLEIEGLSIQILRKPIRNLRLVVLSPSGAVRVSVPKRLAQRDVVAFVRDKLVWIQRQRQRMAELAPLDLLADTPLQKAEQRRQLKERIPVLIAQWEPKLGVKVAAWGIRAMRSRWGSCNPRSARLTFSLALAKYPPDCLDYIVVHEMLHLLEAGHGARYKALMQTHYPDWKLRRALLNGKRLTRF